MFQNTFHRQPQPAPPGRLRTRLFCLVHWPRRNHSSIHHRYPALKIGLPHNLSPIVPISLEFFVLHIPRSVLLRIKKNLQRRHDCQDEKLNRWQIHPVLHSLRLARIFPPDPFALRLLQQDPHEEGKGTSAAKKPGSSGRTDGLLQPHLVNFGGREGEEKVGSDRITPGRANWWDLRSLPGWLFRQESGDPELQTLFPQRVHRKLDRDEEQLSRLQKPPVIVLPEFALMSYNKIKNSKFKI